MSYYHHRHYQRVFRCYSAPLEGPSHGVNSAFQTLIEKVEESLHTGGLELDDFIVINKDPEPESPRPKRRRLNEEATA